MGAILKIIDDDFKTEKNFGYIEDYLLDIIVQKSSEKSFVCLNYILGYENTCFNSAQIEAIEKELDILYNELKDKNILKTLDKIKEAIAFSKIDPPSYLLFEGD